MNWQLPGTFDPRQVTPITSPGGYGSQSGQNPFAFGPMSPLLKEFYESPSGMNDAFSALKQYYGGNMNTMYSRWLNDQYDRLHQQFFAEGLNSPDPTSYSWTDYLQKQAPQLRSTFNALPATMRTQNVLGLTAGRKLW